MTPSAPYRTGRRPRPAIHRVLEKVVVEDRGYKSPCWIFTRMKDRQGYGRIQTGSATTGTRRPTLVHRVTYEFFKGPIPAGLEPDHLCNVTACCNPRHLEAVTHLENMRRMHARGLVSAAAARRTRCSNGHLWSENEVISGKRRKCRACMNQHARDARAR